MSEAEGYKVESGKWKVESGKWGPRAAVTGSEWLVTRWELGDLNTCQRALAGNQAAGRKAERRKWRVEKRIQADGL